MNILVCISKAPDTTSKIAFTNNSTQFDENGVQFIVNPYDEWYALVRALELKETIGGNVTIVTVGTATDEAIIRKALAIGADEAVRIDADPKDAYFVAMQVASYAKAKGFDLVMTGKETINYNGSQVGGMIAEAMDLPFVSLATKLDANGNFLWAKQFGGAATEIGSAIAVDAAGNVYITGQFSGTTDLMNESKSANPSSCNMVASCSAEGPMWRDSKFSCVLMQSHPRSQKNY